MSFNFSPKINTNSLVFCIDPINTKSYISGNTFCYDLKSGNQLSLVNGVGFNGLNFTFNGVDRYINIGTILNQYFQINLPFTIQITFNISSLSSSPGSVLIGNMLTNEFVDGFHIRVTDSGFIRFIMGEVANPYMGIDTTTIFSTNKYYVITATYDGSNTTDGMKLYINGNLETVTPLINGVITSINSTTSCCIGGSSPEEAGAYFNGSISNCFVSNRVLNAIEVMQNYNTIKKRFGL